MPGNVQQTARRTTALFPSLALCLAGAFLLTASGRSGPPETSSGVSLKILDASAPAGGTMQLALTLTEPKPIATGSAALTLDTAVLGPVRGLAVYGPGGAQSDAAGAAVMSGNTLTVRTVSPSSAFGTDATVPILAVTLGVRQGALPGAQAALQLDPAASLWLDPAGQPYAQEVKNGTFLVAGTLSIDDVVPGQGLLPAGSTVVVHGLGFQPGALVEIDGVAVGSTTFVSNTELHAILGASADLYGRRVKVQNPDLTRATYRAYLRAQWLGSSARPLLANTDPIFAPQTFTGGIFTSAVAAGQFFAIALQNPAATPADVTVELRSASAGTIAFAAVTLPARTRMSREASELFAGQSLPAGGSLVVRSSSPVQMLGLLGDESAGTVGPVPASLAFP
jgi:hypothetical protein